ncbi:hypothetical protein [Micromonospora sp. CB01531]|uniref:hypothetical protein n=1 Tax=Micromonospora sp. CB01531 TaxID=1718947 RepID=UPI000939B186|nr:hypothetical protein [Micromonospora sp. CB01531]OKI47239.1 hypothetical protein A6A27_10345 [Micromonospora sp. CB01531]
MSYLTGDPLSVRIRIAFGASIAADPATWAWTDVTQWWHVPDDVQITWGRSSGAEQPERSKISLTLKNTDGRFTSMDPRSPYWPNVRKWTPIQYDIDLGDGVGWRNRFSGFIRRWPLTWPDASGLMALAKIEAVGVLGRLGRGKPPSRSPLRRTIGASAPVAYWPVEDGKTAGQVASAIAGHPPLTLTGIVEFTPVDDYVDLGYTVRFGTSALVDLSAGGRLSGTVPAAATQATSTRWTVTVAAGGLDPATTAGDVVLLEWTTPGATPFVRWRLVAQKSPTRTQVVGYDAGGITTVLIDHIGLSFGFAQYAVSCRQTGANITVELYLGDNDPAFETYSGPGTITGVVSVAANAAGTTSTAQMPFGHVAVWSAQKPPVDFAGRVDASGTTVNAAWASFDAETAHVRFARLCAEDGVPLSVPAVPDLLATRMGAQQSGTSLDLYQHCEDADQGLIYEEGFGLGYLPRASRYNALVALSIDVALGQLGMPFEPVDDDQALRNRWTVERFEGALAVAADQQSIDLQGEIEGSATVNLATDDPLSEHASWRLHLSTVQEPRYPAVSINLATHPELAAAWCACKPGGRVQVVNPPLQNPPGVVDQLVVGATETYRGRRSWRATLNVIPASPWDVATVDGEQRVAVDGSMLAAAISPGDVSLLLTSTAEQGPWTTDPADMPLAVRVGGERVTAAAIGTQLNDGFDRTGSNGWASALWTPFNGATSEYSVGSSQAVIAPPATSQDRGMLYLAGGPDQNIRVRIAGQGTPAGAGIVQGLVLRYVDGSNYYRVVLAYATSGQVSVQLHKRVGGTLTGLGSVNLSLAATADVWLRAAVSGTQLLAKAWANGQPEPPAWDVSAVDSALPVGDWVGVLGRRDTGNTSPTQLVYPHFLVEVPQRVTLSARGVNGFSRAWPAGTPVDTWQPAIVSL